MKLTERQREILERMAAGERIRIRRNQKRLSWEEGFELTETRERLHKGTVNVLRFCNPALIAPQGDHLLPGLLEITDAGRAALKGEGE